MKAEGIIAGRVLKELTSASTVALGPGLPRSLEPFLPQGIQVYSLNGKASPAGPVDVAVVEALEVTPQGDMVVDSGVDLRGVAAERWIVAMLHNHDNGTSKFVRENHYPISRAACVNAIITELGLIRIDPVGFVLRELAPGVSSDDVRQRMDASLHVADDIHVMEL